MSDTIIITNHDCSCSQSIRPSLQKLLDEYPLISDPIFDQYIGKGFGYLKSKLFHGALAKIDESTGQLLVWKLKGKKYKFREYMNSITNRKSLWNLF